MKNFVNNEAKIIEGFENDYDKLIEFCNDAGNSRKKRPEGCSSSFNDWVWDVVPTAEQKLHSAKLKVANFDDLDIDEKHTV